MMMPVTLRYVCDEHSFKLGRIFFLMKYVTPVLSTRTNQLVLMAIN